MKVVYFQRKADIGYYSIEGFFRTMRSYLPSEVQWVVAESTFRSEGILKRLYNAIEAAFRQGDVNHITGDIHYVSFFLRKRKTLLSIMDCEILARTSWIRRQIIKLVWYVIPEKRVALITVISESTKKELQKVITCNPDKIFVIPVCISPSYSFKAYSYNSIKPSILQIGTTLNKNLFRLFEALRDIPCHLTIIGKLSEEHESAINKYGLECSNYIGLSEDDLVRRYQECDIVTLISTYEGFGMPILEANAIGRPVITGNILSMPEVAGDAACIVNPFDVAEIRAGILRVMNDKDYREQLIEKGLRNVLRYRPETIARQYTELYSKLVSSAKKDSLKSA